MSNEVVQCKLCSKAIVVENKMIGVVKRQCRKSSKDGVYHLHGGNGWICNKCNDEIFMIVVDRMRDPRI